MKFHLLGENEKVQIEILSRSYPNSSDYWDVNWVDSKITIEIPGYFVHFDTDIRTDGLKDFMNELKLMNSKLKGRAILKNMDGSIYFECEMNRLGQISWEGETCYPVTFGAVLNFSFQSDQSFLERLIEELEDILSIFPVIGKP
ncbi:WapI family immunity protein [Bacillus sp. JJ722]|uniref:WapI family immunity protein n=1 Tax=Bacillus sp. JJ722 TaxID=3122973 RepID=UPI002FFE3074